MKKLKMNCYDDDMTGPCLYRCPELPWTMCLSCETCLEQLKEFGDITPEEAVLYCG